MEEFEPISDSDYWVKADLRLALKLQNNGLPNTANSPSGVEVVDVNGINIPSATNALNSCSGSEFYVPYRATSSGSTTYHPVGSTWYVNSSNRNFYPSGGHNKLPKRLRIPREYQHDQLFVSGDNPNEYQTVLEIDVEGLMNCIHDNSGNILNSGKALDDESEDGLVFHTTVLGPDSDDAHNGYTVRLVNGEKLYSTRSGAKSPLGLTVVTDQSVAIWGDYNSGSIWKPAAILGDSMNILSNYWDDDTHSPTSQGSRNSRPGSTTTIRAAVVTGIARTGWQNGPGGQDKGVDSNGGGLINFLRMGEDFDGLGSQAELTYEGSIVSFGAPLHSQSQWGPFTYYDAPDRLWSYDTRFNDPDKLPPMTPAFIYLRQELFVRNFEL